VTKELAGKTAFVTGSGRGLGRVMAERLAELGADVAIHDINWTAPAKYGEARDLDAVAAEIAKHGGRVVAVSGTETVFQTWPPQLPGRTPFPSSSAKATVPSNLLLPSRPVLGLWESQPPTSTAMGTSILSQRTMMSPPFPSRSATGEVDFRLTSTMSLDGIQ
jgi:hypothetical protein